MRHQSYEATLLSRGRLDLTQHEAQDDLQEIVEDQGLILERIESVDGTFLMLDCGPVQGLIAFCNDPLPISHFANAARPAGHKWNEDEILGLLHGHKAMATILVTDTPGVPAEDPFQETQKRMLCADLTDWLFTRTLPDLVFWCDTDTLYAGPEFDREGARLALERQSGDRPAPAPAPAHFQTDPPVWDKAESMIYGAETVEAEEAQEPNQTPAEAVVDAMLATALPPWAATRLAKLRDSWDPQGAVKQATRACTACTLSLLGVANYGGPLV